MLGLALLSIVFVGPQTMWGCDRGGAVGDGVGRDLPTLFRDRLQHVPA